MCTSVARSPHRSGNASQGQEMLRQGTLHAKRLLLCSIRLDQHVVQNTICQLAKMGPMGEQQAVLGCVGDSNAQAVEALEGLSAGCFLLWDREHVTS